jgi:hypothetical protein
VKPTQLSLGSVASDLKSAVGLADERQGNGSKTDIYQVTNLFQVMEINPVLKTIPVTDTHPVLKIFQDVSSACHRHGQPQRGGRKVYLRSYSCV